jgi:hypothetical protein
MRYLLNKFITWAELVRPTDCTANVRAFFNYVTTGAFTPVGPLLTPVVKQDFQMNWALLIISKKSILLTENLHLPAFLYPLTFSKQRN